MISISVGRATPDAAGKARPTVNHVIVIELCKPNNEYLQVNELLVSDHREGV